MCVCNLHGYGYGYGWGRCIYGYRIYYSIMVDVTHDAARHAREPESSWVKKRRHRANRTTGVHQLNEPFSNCSADDDDDDGSAGSWHFYLYLLPGPPTRSLALPSSPTLRAARHVSRSPADCRLRLYGSTALWEYGSSADRQKCQGRRQTWI